ncbi:MAG: prepilin peptidase, partial [Candidatus Nanopelagicales bacterium]
MAIGAFIAALFAARVDSFYRVLPNQYTMFVLILGISNCIVLQNAPHTTYVISTLFHLGVAMILPSAFGMGDAKLITGLGLFFADAGVYVAWLSICYGTALLWGKLHKAKSIALGPHKVLAWILCYVGDYAY